MRDWAHQVTTFSHSLSLWKPTTSGTFSWPPSWLPSLWSAPPISKEVPGREFRWCPAWPPGACRLRWVFLRAPCAQWTVGPHIEKRPQAGGLQHRPIHENVKSITELYLSCAILFKISRFCKQLQISTYSWKKKWKDQAFLEAPSHYTSVGKN